MNTRIDKREVSLRYAESFIAAWFASLLFVTSAVHLQNIGGFWMSIVDYELLSVGASSMAAWILSLFGMVLSSLWLNPTTRFAASVGSTFLFLCFLLAQIHGYSLGTDIGCGCFGTVHDQTIGPFTIAFSAFCCFLAFASAILRRADPSGIDCGAGHHRRAGLFGDPSGSVGQGSVASNSV